MQRIFIKDLNEKIGETVKIFGFVQTVRNQGSIKFILLRDVTGIVQLVVLKSHAEAFELASTLTLESVVEVEGLVKQEKQAPGGFEMEAQKITVLSMAAPELPIPVVTEKGGEETEMTKRFDWRWLGSRKPERQQIFKVWNAFEQGCREYFLANNFIQIYTPSFMSTPSESGAEVFEVNYFDKKAYLSQSPQFYKQMAMASGFDRVFISGPVYRAEPSYTTRHVTEFTGLDFEVSYVKEIEEVMAIEEQMLITAFQKINATLGLNLEIPSAPFPKLTIKEAKEKLKAIGVKSEKIHDLNSEEEIELAKLIKAETGHDFVFVKDWHVPPRPFYHMTYENDPETSKSFDLLYRGLEITTGAIREHRYEKLKEQALKAGMSLDGIADYLNFFKYGCPPHGGVGIGPSRIIMKLLELPNVKEAIFLPRDVKRLTP